MVVFALSCFGLLLFLWLSFGGPVPLKPKGYRVAGRLPGGDARSPPRPTCASPACRSARSARSRSATAPTARSRRVELERRYAPLRTDARAVLRQKTLLGETYVELTPGTAQKTIPEDGRLAERAGQADGRARRDLRLAGPGRRAPRSRAGRRSWRRASRAAGATSTTRSARCPASPRDGADVLAVLDTQEGAVQRLVKNTGVVFGALTAERGAAAQPDHGLQAHVRRDRVQERRAGGDDPHLPDVPATSPRRRSRACRRSRRTPIR